VTAPTLKAALDAEKEGLLTCVHCGFCLPACPTYVRLGDENDSPRGRLHLMRAVAEGRLDAGSDAFQTHIDRCLGCRACEPVCPSGVPYGSLLELAREEAVAARRPSLPTRLLVAIFSSRIATTLFHAAGRLVRATGLPALAARVLPSEGLVGRMRLAFAMLAASAAPTSVPGPEPSVRRRGEGEAAARGGVADREEGGGAPVAMLEGCVQAGLFRRVNEATGRVLRRAGCAVVPAPGQGCCGAIHAHAGDLEGARELARHNVDAFERSGAQAVVVNAAGCGAIMKEYGHLLQDDPAYAERAEALASNVEDVSEFLVELRAAPSQEPSAEGARAAKDGPGPEIRGAGGSRERAEARRLRVVYDPPCHLEHAQGVTDAPRRLLEALAGVEVVEADGASECCGGAGIYGLTHAELGGRIGRDKGDALRSAEPDVVATGNPGCIMQIGAGIRMDGGRLVPVVHPVELLDRWSWPEPREGS